MMPWKEGGGEEEEEKEEEGRGRSVGLKAASDRVLRLCEGAADKYRVSLRMARGEMEKAT